MSVWGSDGHKLTWNATVKGLEGAAALYKDSLIALDEIKPGRPPCCRQGAPHHRQRGGKAASCAHIAKDAQENLTRLRLRPTRCIVAAGTAID